ncbi:MFS transporter [Rhodopila sp.]|uniref:MFS transporter n=1 Tax=Rhodopila sp. TaxID=2480087 RepID=UPI003D110636
MTAPTQTASYQLGHKLDSVPFSPYHMLLILVLGTVGFVEGYDLALGGSLIVLAKEPLHLGQADVRWLVAGPTFLVVIGGFTASALSDRLSRKLVMQAGVIISTFFTLLIPLAQNAEQLIVLRLITGIGMGFAIPASFPIAAELMPAQHRRTYGAIYEVMLASAFTLLPFVGYLLAGNPIGFRLIALPGGLALGVVPLLVHYAIPESPRWYLLNARPQAAVDAVNLMIRRCGNRVTALTLAELGADLSIERAALPPFRALFAPEQIRWTVIGTLSGISASVAYYTCAILLPKALVDQGTAVALSFGLSSVLFMASIPGKLFTGYLMEVIGRRWTITYALAGSLPGIALMAAAHLAGSAAAVVFVAGGLITGFTVLSAFPCTRVYLSEQFPTALRGRGHFFGESSGRLIAGVVFPLFMERYTNSPEAFFGILMVAVAIGAFVPLLFGRETVGQLESVTQETRVAAWGRRSRPAL